MMRTTALLFSLAWACAVHAQDHQRIADRVARIDAFYAEERYADVIREVDALIKEAPGTPYADSLHAYLYKYGRAHRKVKDAAAGIAAAERIYGLVKERNHANHEVLALFDLSWTYYDAGEMRQSARVDSIAVVVADGDPSVSLAQRGRARQYLAFDYGALGEYSNSRKWALSAIALYEQSDSIPPAQRAESYTAVGVANWHLGRIRAAEEYYLKAIEVLGDGEEEVILARKVSTNGNLGVLWQNAGDLTRARNYYQASLGYGARIIASTKDQFTRDEAIVHRSKTYLNLATVYHQLGDLGRARELLEIAFRDRSSVLQADDPQLLVVQDRLADLEVSAGDLFKAEALTNVYLTACERKFGTRSEEYIRAASRLGEIADLKGEAARADSLLGLSIAAGLSTADAGTDMLLAQTLRSRARARVKAGRFAEAQADLLHARRIHVRTYDSAHFKVADVDISLAEAAYAAGDHAATLRHARSALGILQDRLLAARTSKVPMAFLDPHLLPDAVYWRVAAERKLGKAASGEWNELIDLAIHALSSNKSTMTDEASKLLLIGAQKRLFDLAMDIAFDQYVAAPGTAAVERFLRLSEADRTILLKQRLNAFAGIRFAGIPDSVIAREQELIAALEVDEADRSFATEISTRERAYAEFMARLEKEHPAYFSLRYGEATVGLEELRARLLKPGRRIVSYARTDEALYALVISVDDARLVRLDANGLSDQVKLLNASIGARDATGYVRAAAALGNAVYGPIASLVGNDELLIIPDGELHVVNFEALLTGEAAGDFRSSLLLQRHAIAYLLSATTAVQFAGLAEGRAAGALALAPGFTDDVKQAYLASIKDSSLIDRRYLRYVRQPFALRTAKGMGGTLNADLMLGGDASERGFRANAERYGILHLGTHAEMNAASPMYSRLVLSKDGEGVDPDADGYLHAYEIYELDLRAQLAVLTACETGTGLNDGEGVRSLGYSFAYAGCPSLVMSLWSIDEKTSSEIIARFYEHLADGLPKHQALRRAKLDHLEKASKELRMPHYWAGLVLVGDVEPVALSTTRWWLWVAGGLLLAGLLVYFIRSRR